MSKVRVGFIGAGKLVSQAHLPTARDSAIMEIRAIADLNEDLLAQHKKYFPVRYTTTDYRKVLDDPDIDLVVIGTKQDLHAKMIVEGLEAGKWVFCEKPMAETFEETQAVLLAERNNPGRLAIGLNRRFAPAYRAAHTLMRNVKRPWFIHYRLMGPNLIQQTPGGFYADRPRIVYEGCHILDLLCWFLGEVPKRVYMTGDRLLNNCCILDFPDGSQVTFMCGSIGSTCLWKEYMEIFGAYAAVTVSEFTDLRVRGIPGEFDRIFPPHHHAEQKQQIERYGFDFYEMYSVYHNHKYFSDRFGEWKDDTVFEQVKRPAADFDVAEFHTDDPEPKFFVCDKGWRQSLEHFAQCLLDGTEPENADGAAGTLSTRLALALLESLELGQPVNFQYERNGTK